MLYGYRPLAYSALLRIFMECAKEAWSQDAAVSWDSPSLLKLSQQIELACIAAVNTILNTFTLHDSEARQVVHGSISRQTLHNAIEGVIPQIFGENHYSRQKKRIKLFYSLIYSTVSKWQNEINCRKKGNI